MKICNGCKCTYFSDIEQCPNCHSTSFTYVDPKNAPKQRPMSVRLAEEHERFLERERRIEELTKVQPNLPKCPTCGSHRYRKITNTKRALSFLTWGLASDKIGKQFECMDCGYKW